MQGEGRPDEDKLKMQVTTTSVPLPGTTSQTGPRSGKPLPADIQAQVGRRLMAIYDAVLQQPVPDRFRQLLDTLDQKTGPLSGRRSQGDGDNI